mmetsp:Transcript_21188/g.18809  ORF Transcript_21188/g.18809 Transcript_21188/m.18809 type:complete len:156 (+) Transcript_21188:3-470(+)
MSQDNKERGRQRLTKILEERKAEEEANKHSHKEADNQSWRKRVFGFTKKLAAEDIPDVDIKGNRHRRQSAAGVNQSQIERQLFKMEGGPRMLQRKQRFKAWMGLGMVGVWFTSCFFLIQYRLRSDDLELMEREVYEDLAKKREVEKLQKRYSNYD